MSPLPVFGVEASIPAQCAGLVYHSVNYYDDPRLGIGIRYDGPAYIHADTYLYNMGRPYITDDLMSPQVIHWFLEACDSITKHAEMEAYQNIEVLECRILNFPKDDPQPFWHYASFTYKRADEEGSIYTDPLISHIALRIDRGFINKVWFSYPNTVELSEVGIRGFFDFLIEWTLTVQNF